MIKTIVICDKCGRELLPGEQMQINGLDLCEECFDALCDVIQEWIDNDQVEEIEEIVEEYDVSAYDPTLSEVGDDVSFEEPVEEVVEEKRTTKKDYDWDKACALKIAGWANKDIAEECKIKESTLSAMIYKKVTAFKEKKKKEQEETKRKVQSVNW